MSFLLLDLDGTLTDSKPGILASFRYALEKLGRSIDPSEDLDWCIGPPARVNFTKLLDTSDINLVETAMKWYRQRYETIGMFENDVYPGVIDMLDSLKDLRIRMFIATAKPLVFAEKIVKHFGLIDYFEQVYGSELDGRFSDKSELIRHILREQILTGHGMMIGDRHHDITAAKQNDLLAAGVTYGYGSIEELNTDGADVLFNTPDELVRFFAK